MTNTLNARFAPMYAHFADCEAGQEALAEYELAREQGKDHDEACVLASNVLQRAGYNVNAKGGISIDVDPGLVTFGRKLVEYFARMVRRKYFYFGRTKMPKAARFFVIDMTNEYEVARATRMLVRIGQFFSHKELQRTPAADRFCPYVLLRGMTPDQLIELKASLWAQGVVFNDGYPFQGAEFLPAMLAVDPTKEKLWTIKFVPSEHQLAPTLAACTGSVIEVYDFYKDKPLDSTLVPKACALHSIKSNSAYLLQEVLQA